METYKIKYDNEFENEIVKYISKVDNAYSHSAVNVHHEKLSLMEKISYDIALFHLTKMNMTLKNKKISFWTKSKRASCLNCSYPHTDGDDYERNVYNNSTIKPLFTTLTYFNDNDLNPTIITQITKEHVTKNKVANKDISLIFPKTNLHIFFEGQTFFHFESNFFNIDKEINKDRCLLIVAVWNNYWPMFVPFYNYSIQNYAMFSKTNKKIIQTQFEKNIKFIKSFEKSNKTNIIETNNLTDSFFHNLLLYIKGSDTESDKIISQNLFKVLASEITKEMTSNNNVIIMKSTDQKNCVGNDDKLEIKKSQISMSSINIFMRSFLKTYSICLREGMESNFSILLDECIKSDTTKNAYYLNKSQISYSFIEKFIYENAIHDLLFINNKESANYKIEDIHVEYWFKSTSTYKNNNMHIDSNDISAKDQGMSQRPVLSSVIYLNDNCNPTLMTNFDVNDFKYKNFKNFNLFLSFPKRFKKLLLEGGQYFHAEATIFDIEKYGNSRNAIVINYWLNNQIAPSDLIKHDDTNNIYNTNINLLDFVIDDKCLKVELFDDILNNSFYQNILYKKSDKETDFKSIEKVFTDIELENNSNILLVSNINVADVVEKQSKLKAFDFFDMSTIIKKSDFAVKKTMRSFIDMSGCEFIKNEIIKNNENAQEICTDVSLFNTIENYLIEQNLFQKLVEKTIMYYNIEKTININIEKITINTTKFLKNIKNTNNSILCVCFIDANKDNKYITFEQNNLFEFEIGDLIFFNSEVNFVENGIYLLFFLNFTNN
jgi:hypothetical protein